MPTAYEQDYYAWVMENAELIRQRRFSEIDLEHVAEELESMGRSEKRELINRLAILFAHLLKWTYQPERRSKSWSNTIKVQRVDLQAVLKDNPSLRAQKEEAVAWAYRKAKLLAADETNKDETDFPDGCPYSFEEAMDENFWPEPTAPE